jgi:hypothetical protein
MVQIGRIMYRVFFTTRPNFNEICLEIRKFCVIVSSLTERIFVNFAFRRQRPCEVLPYQIY